MCHMIIEDLDPLLPSEEVAKLLDSHNNNLQKRVVTGFSPVSLVRLRVLPTVGPVLTEIYNQYKPAPKPEIEDVDRTGLLDPEDLPDIDVEEIFNS